MMVRRCAATLSIFLVVLCLGFILHQDATAAFSSKLSSSSRSTTTTSPRRTTTSTIDRKPTIVAPSVLVGSPLYSTRSDDDDNTGGLSRRQFNELAFAAVGLGITFLGTRENDPTDYGLWGILPVGTYKQKKSITETIVPDQVWTFDQKFGILNVQVPLRMTILKLSTGGLLVYNPIAATKELLGMVDKIVQQHGPIKHVVLGSVALEHKVYAGVFAQKFKDAQVWIQPGQYSFPTDLPTSFLGFPSGRTHIMPTSMDDAPSDWKADIDFLTLGPFISRDGSFGETVLYHKPTKTMLVTDTVVDVSPEVPPIYDTDPEPLLYHARDTITDVVQDTPEVRKKGWRRVVLFGLFFQPSAINIKDAGVALKERRPDINPDFAGIYPWDWIGTGDEDSFNAIAGRDGGLLVAPILQKLILNRSPIEVLDFADQVVQKWPDIQRIIPAHLKNNLKYGAKDYRKAFSFLEASGVPPGLPKPLEADLETLANADVSLQESGAIAPCPPLPGGKVSREEILKQTVYQCRSDVCAPRSKA
mmetsp:Transcript_27448/g.40309  ORF Transcript_27448/g.40309 Transcript_27448/m.40309 type:complete len:531 (-) Transcript_27448:145-1737(-)|eukprot:CAMPEP_0194049332 /NCGR_PEP_ID=MMETSP0009_2-20130614/30380_1 /TAXON_ID=210454 /ORGANISM="Grammatophora oceanica, Strain CCMP 410" /LENGTH=530 /DNA_ID=CAMNT_0038695459 /DNA_START=65 /DNA_END=1657 /DNA_ORIENTATION=-